MKTAFRYRNGALAATGIAALALLSVGGAWAQDTDSVPDVHGGGGGGPRVVVDGSPVDFSGQRPVEQDGRVLVPLRGVLEKLGAYVEYHADDRSVTAFRGDTHIRLPIGGQQARIDGRNVSLDVPAQIINGSTMVPLRFVAESLGAEVRWDAPRDVVLIRTNGNAASAVYGGGPRDHDRTRDTERPGPGIDVNGAGWTGGEIVAVHPDATPPRVDIRLHPGSGDAVVRTIPLARDSHIDLRTRDGAGERSIDAAQLRPGDHVRVHLLPDGRAVAIMVMPGR